jgi:hypothetical protein
MAASEIGLVKWGMRPTKWVSHMFAIFMNSVMPPVLGTVTRA